MPPCNPFTSKLKHTGDRNAASYQGAFRFACVQDRGCRGTPHFAGTRAFRSLDAGAEMHGGVLSRWGAGVCFFRGGVLKRVDLKLWNLKKRNRRWTQMNADFTKNRLF